jgi:hypothetical protein
MTALAGDVSDRLAPSPCGHRARSSDRFFGGVAPVLVVGGCCSNGLRLGWYQSEKGVLWSSLHARVVKMPAPAGGPTRPALL